MSDTEPDGGIPLQHTFAYNQHFSLLQKNESKSIWLYNKNSNSYYLAEVSGWVSVKVFANKVFKTYYVDLTLKLSCLKFMHYPLKLRQLRIVCACDTCPKHQKYLSNILKMKSFFELTA